MHRINCNSHGYYCVCFPVRGGFQNTTSFFVLYSGYFSNYLSLNIQQFGILPNIVTLLPPKKAGLLS